MHKSALVAVDEALGVVASSRSAQGPEAKATGPPLLLITPSQYGLVYGRVERKGLVTSCLSPSLPPLNPNAINTVFPISHRAPTQIRSNRDEAGDEKGHEREQRQLPPHAHING